MHDLRYRDGNVLVGQKTIEKERIGFPPLLLITFALFFYFQNGGRKVWSENLGNEGWFLFTLVGKKNKTKLEILEQVTQMPKNHLMHLPNLSRAPSLRGQR